MQSVILAHHEDFEGWRTAARSLALAGVPAAEVTWTVADEGSDLFADEGLPDAHPNVRLSVPKEFLSLAGSVICHSDRERFGLLYAMLWKLQDNRKALEDRADPLLKRLEVMRKAVGRDIHKMRAFVRFREAEDGDGNVRYIAWFEPEHHIVRTNAPFFQRRFASMYWSILTPELCAHWNGQALAFSPGATKADAPGGDPVEETWKTYYRSIFNPARVKVKAMTAEMPKKYWKNMPETALVPELIAGARGRELEMVERSQRVAPKELTPPPPAETVMAEITSWEDLAAEAQRRHGEDTGNSGTQLVFGEGPRDAKLMLVGEQPGDAEDRAGRPFVGPAGQILDDALEKAGIERSKTYVTNAVKRFKFKQRGKRRIHSKPGAYEIDHFRWWLEAERTLVQPKVTVGLGATAGRALMQKVVTISKVRGEIIELPSGGSGLITVHPSYLLRIPDKAKAEDETARFIEDLETARKYAEA